MNGRPLPSKRSHRGLPRPVFGVALLLLCSVSGRAGSLEFRSDGFFASPDARVKFFRESWRFDAHLDVDGKSMVSFVGPIVHPGYNTLSPAETQTEVDPARRRITDSGTIGKLSAPCRRVFTDYKGGMLMRLEFATADSGGESATARLLFPVGAFENHRARWRGGEVVFPAEKPGPGRFSFLSDPSGRANLFRFDLGNGRELGVKFLSRIKTVSLSDCREWNEANYHLTADFEGRTMLVYVCLLGPDEPFPEVDAPPEPAAPPDARIVAQGASFPALDGQAEILVTRAGGIQVNKKGSPLLGLECPEVQANGVRAAFAEPVSFEAKANRVNVVSKVKDRPFFLRQSVSMDEEGWLTVAAVFEGEGLESGGLEAQWVLPAAEFAGKTLCAGERFIGLPANAASNETLLDDWNGSVSAYDIPAGGADRVALVCDATAATAVRDYRKWNQRSFKIGMRPKGGVLSYRLRLRRWEDAPSVLAKGNLLGGGAGFEIGPEGVQAFSSYSWNEKMIEPGIPPVFDTTTAFQGTTSLRLTAADPAKRGSLRGFAFVGAAFNRVELKRDRTYTVSAWMKADRPGMKGTLYCGESTWAGEDWGTFPVTTEWKRYHFTFHTADFKKSGYFLTWAGMASDAREGSLWIDAVQLEEGDLTDFQPSAGAEHGVEITKPEKLFETGEPCAAILHVRNNTPAPLVETVPYVIRDYWDAPVRSGALAVKVAGGATAAFPVAIGKLPAGYYRGYFAVPGGGARELIFGVYQPQPLTPTPEDWPLACHNDPSPLVRKIGFGSVRAFEVFEFSDIAPERGRFDFSRSDRMVERARQCGLTLLPILGEFRWPSYRPQPPVLPYAQKEITGSGSERLVWPALEAWKDYVRALTGRYKGVITHWEVLNEPNLAMSARQYVPYLKAAYEAAKEGNPDCKVVGVCATSDFSGKPDPFTDGVLGLGAANFFDVLSVHLYDARPPEESLGAGSDRLIENWRQTLQKHGREIPVWHTEKSYSARELGYSRGKNDVPVEYCAEPQFLIDTFRHKAEYMIRETILDAVTGKPGRFYWFGVFGAPNFISTQPYQPYGLDHTEFDQSPCPELVAANGLARAIDGMSRPFGRLVLGESVYCGLFTGKQGSVCALWDWKRRSRIVLPVGSAPFVLRNFFGEPVPMVANAKGELVVELDGAPKYLMLPGVAGDACRDLMGKGRVEAVDGENQ